MIDGILKFPSTARAQPIQRMLVQMRLDAEFIKAIDMWRVAQPDMPARTKATLNGNRLGRSNDEGRQEAQEMIQTLIELSGLCWPWC